MRTALVLALVAAAVSACEGKYPPDYYNRGDAGDAGGPDAGDGGQADAGDAGCVPLSLNTAGIIDGCFANGFSTTGSVSVNTASCTADINTGTNFVCHGDVSGAHDAFDGGCNDIPCHSQSLPGTIICNTSATTSCTIVVCDGGC